ncbi:hypothetical protein [Cellulomonas iranensis]|uniref:hypothetical protein n=1 Tax=Cellulomonas iranensis TaxID=76862 RepID=UPI0013D7E5DD|nr:hypothetical protein [Cellulomonas iranensis]
MNAISKIAALAATAALAITLSACGTSEPTPEPTDPTPAATQTPAETPEPTTTPEPVAPVVGDQVPAEDAKALREQGLSVYVSPTGTAYVVDASTPTVIPAPVAADIEAMPGVTAADDAEFRANSAAYAATAQAIVDAGLGAILVREATSFRDGKWSSDGQYVYGSIGAAKGLCGSGNPASYEAVMAGAQECSASSGYQVFDLTR